MSTIVLLVVLAVIVLWVIGAYNGLISLKNQVANAWKQIDVQLKRRHDLIPNLVNTVKGAMDFERSTLEAVIAARNKAVSATGVKDTARAEGELTQALGRLFALTEAYHPHGLNMGVNIGKPAGAGILDHVHMHVVPRWNGDTNFMTVVGRTRVLAEELPSTADRLRPIFERLAHA